MKNEQINRKNELFMLSTKYAVVKYVCIVLQSVFLVSNNRNGILKKFVHTEC